ncbi:MAG: AbrB/MazE/SpoVT family DNA-binding domain-containing protein [Acidobacteria bacterium]|nr:AbrB/MazE/SpoVT family DNA-binding domain-containing protein [Acidobacteriota bacterium]
MRIGERGQVTIPKSLREKYDEVTFIESRGDLILRKARAAAVRSGIRKWVGRLSMPESVDEFIDDIRGS